jgi:hypothetical protein
MFQRPFPQYSHIYVRDATVAVVMVFTLAAAVVVEESSKPGVPQVCSADPRGSVDLFM